MSGAFVPCGVMLTRRRACSKPATVRAMGACQEADTFAYVAMLSHPMCRKHGERYARHWTGGRNGTYAVVDLGATCVRAGVEKPGLNRRVA